MAILKAFQAGDQIYSNHNVKRAVTSTQNDSPVALVESNDGKIDLIRGSGVSFVQEGLEKSYDEISETLSLN